MDARPSNDPELTHDMEVFLAEQDPMASVSRLTEALQRRYCLINWDSLPDITVRTDGRDQWEAFTYKPSPDGPVVQINAVTLYPTPEELREEARLLLAVAISMEGANEYRLKTRRDTEARLIFQQSGYNQLSEGEQRAVDRILRLQDQISG